MSGRVVIPQVVAPVCSPFGRGFTDWLLAQVGNGMLWSFRADPGFVTSSGGTVSAVADRSGGNDPLVQASGLNKPTLTTNWRNGRDAITFPGTRFMATTSAHCPTDAVGYSWGGVFEFTNVASSRCPLALGATGVPSYTIESSAHTVRYIGSGTMVGPGTSLTTANDVVITRAAGVTAATKLYINAVEHALTPTTMGQGAPSGAIVLGAIDVAKTFPFIGSCPEAFLKTGVMSLVDVRARYAYTSARYGL